MVPKDNISLEPVSVRSHGKSEDMITTFREWQEEAILCSLGITEVTQEEGQGGFNSSKEDAPSLGLEMIEEHKEPRLV